MKVVFTIGLSWVKEVEPKTELNRKQGKWRTSVNRAVLRQAPGIG